MIVDTIYNKNGTRILQTTYSKWVIKMNDYHKQAAYELRVVIDLFFSEPRHAVELYPRLDDLYGNGWYVLKRYGDHVQLNTFCRLHWRTIGIHVLEFLQDFHHDVGLIHMDIKKGNIFVDYDSVNFVVGDYENASTPCTETTISSYSDDSKWYYASMGAEFSSPILSWRFDFVALGYVLASLTVDSDKWTFEQECWERREGNGTTYLTNDDVMEIRTNELSLANPAVVEYMKLVNTLPWDSKEPPPRSFYLELESLISLKK